MKTSSKLLVILAAVILYSAGVLTGAGVVKERVKLDQVEKAAAPVEQAQGASVLIDTGADLFGFPNIQVNDGNTVWSVLERLSQQQVDLGVESEQYQDMGRLVKSIKGFANGTDGQYWQYWLNNKYADLAADKKPVKPGDVIMWKFTKAQFKEY